MTILITGATGFIGRHVCAELSKNQTLIAVLRQPEQQLPLLRQQVDALGGNGAHIQAVAGDLERPKLGIKDSLPTLDAVIHLAARFAWKLAPNIAHNSNVGGSLAAAELARQHKCRLVFISGFMLENHQHLNRLGIHPTDPERTDWRRVYRRAGAYEASKLEAAFRVRAFAQANDMDLVEVQPATVAGHSQTGMLDAQQPLFNLLDNLAHGRLAMVPGSPEHWLPLVAVDVLATLIAHATTSENAPRRLLALDANTPNLQGTLAIAAQALDMAAPNRHLPLRALAWLLRIPGMPTVMNTSPEALNFIQTTRFDTRDTQQFMQQQGLKTPDIAQVIAHSAQFYHHLQQAALSPAAS